MGIEIRGNGLYYYRKVRRGGRVVSEYVGGGELALAGSMADEDAHSERAEAEAAWRAERGRMEAEDRAFAGYFDAVEARAREMLTAMGYHRPKRRWRKRRVDANTTTPAAPGGGAGCPAEGEIGMDLLNRAIAGEEGPQKQLIGLMKDPEVGGKIVDFFGDLRQYAERVAIAEVAGESRLVLEAITRKVERLREELAGPAPTAIERLLAERAAYSWFVLWRYEHHLANAKDLSTKREEFHHRRIDAAHRRYLSSLRALATVRKLALPSVQVNIGRAQVNVAGPT